MSTLTVRLPKSLHAKIKELAHAEGISMNQFLVLAAAEKMAALLTEDYLAREAQQGMLQRLAPLPNHPSPSS